MLRPLVFITFLFLYGKQSKAQPGGRSADFHINIPVASSNTTNGLVQFIKQNYTTDTARVKAVYGWIVNNISYDLELLQNRLVNEGKKPPTADEVLSSKKGVCQGYATLFVDLCIGLGIEAHIVPGYGKIGNTVTPVSHAWVGARLNGKWYLFDPTWGAGYVENNRFVKSVNSRFFMVAPEQMLQDHMPFDPTYQFVYYPINNKEFIDGQTSINTTKPYFNYGDTLKQHALLSQTEKFKAELRRLEGNGVHHDVIREQLRQLRKGAEVYGSNDAYALAITHHKQAGALYTQYLEQRKKKFADIEDGALKKLIDSVFYYTNLSRTVLFTIVTKDEAYRQNLAGFHQNLENFQKGLVSEKDMVNRYLSLDKAARQRFFGAPR